MIIFSTKFYVNKELTMENSLNWHLIGLMVVHIMDLIQYVGMVNHYMK